MHQTERIKHIEEILKKNGFVTVKFLTEELHYSTATINRDLNMMEKQKMVRRSYGGVELLKNRSVPLVFRYNKMRPAKNKIGKKAAEFIHDGETIFIDDRQRFFPYQYTKHQSVFFCPHSIIRYLCFIAK